MLSSKASKKKARDKTTAEVIQVHVHSSMYVRIYPVGESRIMSCVCLSIRPGGRVRSTMTFTISMTRKDLAVHYMNAKIRDHEIYSHASVAVAAKEANEYVVEMPRTRVIRVRTYMELSINAGIICD